MISARICVLQFLVLAVIIDEVAAFDVGQTGSIVLSPARRLVPRYKRRASTAAKYPDITEMLVTSDVQSRFATVRVSSVVTNRDTEGSEASFSVQVPETAFISNFTMVINDTFYVGQVYEKTVAQEKYDSAKKQGQSAGQVRHRERNVARAMDVFELNVNVAAESSVHFELTYQELLERRLGLYTQRLIVQPMQIVENLTLDMTYTEPQDISRFEYRLPHNEEIHTASSTANHATFEASSTTRRIVYTPSVSLQEQIDASSGIDGELVVSYDVAHPGDGGSIVSAGNYFVHYFAVDKSREFPVEAKNVMFVIDVSGSMAGRKIEQTRAAMMVILPQLNEIDYFNIMIFDDSPTVWQSDSIRATPSNILRAKAYVEENVKDGGGTNINAALLESVKLVANAPETISRVPMIVFLTDGVPTAGVTELKVIRQNIKKRNEFNRVAIFCLGFGSGVDFQFLSQISFENNGFPRRIYEESDAAKQLLDFYKEVNSPVCRDVKFLYNSDQVVVAGLSQTEYKQYYSGSEIVVVRKRKEDVIDASVICLTKEKRVELVVPPQSRLELLGANGEFVKKLYAYKIIKYLLMKMSIADTKEEAARLEDKALKMSLSFNFVTPLTSLVVIQDSEKELLNNERLAFDNKIYASISSCPTCHLELVLMVVILVTTCSL